MKNKACLDCQRPGLTLVANGLCGSCYARSHKNAAPKLAEAQEPVAGQENEPDFNALFVAIRQTCKAYRQVRKQNVKLQARFSDLKMKFIVMSYKKWSKKYLAAMTEMKAALKDLPKPEPEVEELMPPGEAAA